MTRSKVLSALALTGLFVGLTVAQTPQPPAKPADATAEALRNHPDIRVAEAKVRMAEAELAQAKLLVAQRIAIAEAKVQGYNLQVAHATKILKQASGLGGATARHEVLVFEKDVAVAKVLLVGAEAELAAARGVPLGSDSRVPTDAAVHFLKAKQGDATDTAAYLAWLYLSQQKQAPVGSATDMLRELLDKRVKVGVKRRPFDDAMSEFIKQAGLEGITIRAPDWASAKTLKEPPMVGPLDGEQTVAGWLQLIVDDFNQSLGGVPPAHGEKHDIYIREYGLLMTKTSLAPPGALTLNEFVQQLRIGKTLEKASPKN